MKGPKAMLSLYEIMTIYEGSEGAVVIPFRGHRDQNMIYLIDPDGPRYQNITYMLQTYSLMAFQSIPLLGQIQAIRFITFSVHIS